MFWRHKEPDPLSERPPELGLGREHDMALGLDDQDFGPAAGLAPPGVPSAASPGIPPVPPGTQAVPPSMHESMQPSALPQDTLAKDVQILNAKLDSLKAILDNINQRLANIERIAHEAQQSEKQDTYERF